MQFSTETMRPADRFEAYRSLYAGGTDAIRLGAQFSARLEARPLGEMVAFERWLDHVGHERTMRRIRQDGFEHFVMQLNLSGRLVAHAGDVPFATLLGRRGGSAIAGGAFNGALLAEAGR